MYIRGLIPRNFAELAEAVAIDFGAVLFRVNESKLFHFIMHVSFDFCFIVKTTLIFSGIPFYKAGSTCTKCDGDTSFCDNGLCGKFHGRIQRGGGTGGPDPL